MATLWIQIVLLVMVIVLGLAEIIIAGLLLYSVKNNEVDEMKEAELASFAFYDEVRIKMFSIPYEPRSDSPLVPAARASEQAETPRADQLDNL